MTGIDQRRSTLRGPRASLIQLTQYDERGWRAPFYTTGMEHSPTSATGTAWERTSWQATQRATWGGIETRGRRYLGWSRVSLYTRRQPPFQIPEIVALGVKVHGQPPGCDCLDSVLVGGDRLTAAITWSSIAQATPNVHRVDTWREAVNQSLLNLPLNRLREHLSTMEPVGPSSCYRAIP